MAQTLPALRKAILNPRAFVAPDLITTYGPKGRIYLPGTLLKLADLGPVLRNTNTATDPRQDGIGPHGWATLDGTRTWFHEAYGPTGEPAVNNDTTGPMKATASSWQGSWIDSPSTLVIAPNNSNWEFGEFSPQNVIIDTVNNRLIATFHGGNNQGPRQIGVAYSTDGYGASSGLSWTKDPGNPLYTPGAGGSYDDGGLADLRLIWSPNIQQWVGLYRANKVGGPADGQIARMIGPAPNLLVKTGLVVTPPSWNTAGIAPGGLWYDAGGRLHMFAAASSAGIAYYWSDDDGQTWAGGAQVLSRNATSGAYDRDAGGTVQLIPDGDTLVVTYLCQNITDYGSNPPLRGIAASVIPAVSANPARKGKWYPTNSRTNTTSTALLTQTVFTIMGQFKAYQVKRASTRMIYTEEASGGSFNKIFSLQMNANNGGKLQAFYRTPTAIVTINSLAAVDDALWHTFIFRRTAANAFELIVDGVSQGTSTNNPSTDATAMIKSIGNIDPATLEADSPWNGTIANLGIVTGYAATNTEVTNWINSRAALGGGTVVFDSAINGTDVGGVSVVDATPLVVTPGTGSAAGTGAATGVGQAQALATGSSVGTGTAAAIAMGIGSAAGVGAATGVSTAGSSLGAAAGVGAATAVGQSTATGTGSAAGTGTGTGVGSSLAAGVGNAAGTGAATGTGSSIAVGVGAAAGVGLASAFTGTAGSAAGTGAATGVGLSLALATGSASGASTATAAGGALVSATGSATGAGAATATGKAFVTGVGLSAGFGVAVGAGQSIAQAIGFSAGVSLASGSSIIPFAPAPTSRTRAVQRQSRVGKVSR